MIKSEPEVGVSKLGSSHREGRVGCAEDLKGPHLGDNYCHCTPARPFSPFMIVFIVHLCKYQRFMNRRMTSAQSHPNLETILVVLEEVCELLGRRHPIVVEGSVPRCEVLEGKLVRLEGLLILVDVARPEESFEAGHVLSQHAQLWQYCALKSPKSAFR